MTIDISAGDPMTDCGVIYYATGTKFVKQALLSAESLKQHNNLPVTVYSDKEIESPYVDNVVTITPSEYPFYDRINYFKRTPYDKTLYIDTDTYIAGDLTPIFELLDRFEVTAAFNESRDTVAAHTKFKTVDLDVPEAFPEYQCGVIGYQNTTAVDELFDDWQARYKPYRDEHVLDQPHFREALYNNRIVLGTLPTEYNVLVNFSGYLHSSAKLLHYAGNNRPFLGDGTPTVEALQETVGRLNADAPQNRVFFGGTGGEFRVVTGREKSTLLRRIITHIRNEGPWRTFTKGIKKLSQA
jgi:hypothetical protein